MRVKIGGLEKTLKLMARGGVEAVGLLLGSRREDAVECRALFRADNELKSGSLFEANPWHVVQAHLAAEAYGLEVVALFHTHSSCPPEPSPLDVEGMKRWPIPWVIACPSEVKAWTLRDGVLEELPVEL
ncbi:MAG: M67 family metallopeptidase [Acidilobaceae archaeon]